MNRPKITIVGSINMDLVTLTDVVAQQGETVAGKDFHTMFGGKGANQAVAASRLGADVSMIGKVGNDAFGSELLQNFKGHDINVDGVTVEEGAPTGIANIIVSDKDNRIIFVEGANGKVDAAHVDLHRDIIRHSDIVLIQFEIPKETLEHIIKVCKEDDVPLVVNPAPVIELEESSFEDATYITPNEHERNILFRKRKDGLPQFYSRLITTQGSQGASYFKEGREIVIPADKVDVVDTTGAGDTFNAAFAVGAAEGMPIEEAIAFANDAGAIAVTKLGAQSGMPSRQELDSKGQADDV